MLRSWTFNFRRLYSAATDVKRAASEIPFPAPTTNTATNNRNTANNSNHKYNCNSIRTGALGIKKGMMSYWDTWGKMHPVTILHVNIFNIINFNISIFSWITFKLWIPLNAAAPSSRTSPSPTNLRIKPIRLNLNISRSAGRRLNLKCTGLRFRRGRRWIKVNLFMQLILWLGNMLTSSGKGKIVRYN